jgi:hypothetical protein
MSELYFSKNYIDIFSVSQYKLAVYPLFLVFGQPLFDSNSQEVKFNQHKSLKIQENYLSSWLHFLSCVILNYVEDQHVEGQQLIYSETPVNEENKNNLQNQKNCYFYETEKNEDTSFYKVKIFSTFTKEPLQFTLDSWEFFELCQAFSSIFFKLYCYTPTQNLCIEHFINNENSGHVKECSLYEAYLHLRAQTLFPLSVNECIRTAELIIRHKNILIEWKKLAVLL